MEQKYIIKLNINNKEVFYLPFENKICNCLDCNYIDILDLRVPFKINSIDFEFPMNYEQYQWKREHRLKQVVLSITGYCNMRCKYCSYYEERYVNQNIHHMDESTLFAAINWFHRKSILTEKPIITFYGGEPLLKFDLIRKAVEYADNLFEQVVEYTITTNGLVLTEEVVEFFVKHNFRCTVSLDGPREIHDRYRRDINGQDTYDKIITNLKYICKKYPLFFENNLHFNTVLAPPLNLEEVFEFFNGLSLSTLDVDITNFFQNYLEKNRINKKLEVSEDLDISKYSIAKKFHESLERYHNYVPPFDKAFMPGGYCYPLEKRVYVTYDGRVTLCEKVDETCDKFIMGNIVEGIFQEKIDELISDAKKVMENNCTHCWAGYFCQCCFAEYEKIDFEGAYCKKMRQNIRQQLEMYYSSVDADSRWKDFYDHILVYY